MFPEGKECPSCFSKPHFKCSVAGPFKKSQASVCQAYLRDCVEIHDPTLAANLAWSSCTDTDQFHLFITGPKLNEQFVSRTCWLASLQRRKDGRSACWFLAHSPCVRISWQSQITEPSLMSTVWKQILHSRNTIRGMSLVRRETVQFREKERRKQCWLAHVLPRATTQENF